MNIFDLIIVQPIFNMLLFIYSLIPGGDFGVALIIFTIIIRMILYPLVRRQLHQTRMMRKLQPELKKIKARTKGDKQAEAAQMMELYKQHGVSPFRSIGILLLQLPIFIGLYHVVQIFTINRGQIEHFTYSFLHQLGPVQDLIAHPDQLNLKLFGLIDLSKSAVAGGDIWLFGLALIAAYTQYVISKQTAPTTPEGKKTFREILAEAADGKQTDQAEINGVVMQKMMKVMPIFMFFIMISVPGALALYYGVSNLVAVAQQSYLLRQDEVELEEIADEPTIETEQKSKKNPKAKSSKRASAAKEAHVTRIVAKEGKRR